MKNIHVLPTDKPSRLLKTIPKGNLLLSKKHTMGSHWENKNVYITSDKEIKEGDWVIKISSIYKGGGIAQKYSFIDAQFEDIIFKKIILTTDASLDDVQAIDDEFLEWFVKNPSCEEIELKKGFADGTAWGYNFLDYKIIIPKEEPKQLNSEDFGLPKFGTKGFNDLASGLFGGKPIQEKLTYTESAKKEERISNCTMMKRKQETVEEAAERLWLDSKSQLTSKNSFIQGAKWMQERMYSKEELEVAFFEGRENNLPFTEWFEKFKKQDLWV